MKSRESRHMAYAAGLMFGMSALYGWQAYSWFSLKALVGALITMALGCLFV